MKKMLLVFSCLFALNASATSVVAPGEGTLVSKVTSAQMDPKITASTIVSGYISYNLNTKTVTLDLTKAGPCGTKSCDNLKLEVELPIIKVEKTLCGLKITAEENLLPVDGLRQRIELKDMTNARCKIYVAPSEVVTVVFKTEYYNHFDVELVRTISTIKGETPQLIGRAVINN